MTRQIRYSDVVALPTFEERYELLKRGARIGDITFGGFRPLNQDFYKSKIWKQTRDAVIVRDAGCDLAHPDYILQDQLIVHHINPITADELSHGDFSSALDMENLILTCFNTHNAIHYGVTHNPYGHWAVRTPNDTCPWR